ncbi:hypothetical protein ACIP9X_19730 [Arthrobacter sp. NPDC093125]|uniref:hypothetical protein n=1 Tax=Arthrobacter sp. NPDC093125 TaxID=3363944 RepID=UPI0038220810
MAKGFDRTSHEDQRARYLGKPLRLSAVLLVVGFFLFVMMGLLHPGGPANNHGAVFVEYAASAGWTAVHLGQFAGMAVIIAGLLVLYFTLDFGSGAAAWLARLGAVSAGWRLGSTASYRRWTGSLSNRPLMRG